MEKHTEPLAVVICGWLRTFIDYFICIYLFIIIVVLPLYAPDGYRYIATKKSAFFCSISISMGKMIMPVLLLYMGMYFFTSCRKNRHIFNKAVQSYKVLHTDFFVCLYGIAVILSFLCSEYQDYALWGADGWHMGFYPQMMLICIYFLVSKFWKPRKSFFYLLFAASAIVFFLGYLNRFNIQPVKMELNSPDFISTIGNINWHCSYMVTILFAGVFLLWQGSGMERWQNVLLAFYAAIGFAALATQGSASGIVTLGVMLLAMFGLSAAKGIIMQRFWAVAMLFSFACLFTERLRSMMPERFTYQDTCIDFLTTGIVPLLITIVSCVMFWQIKLLIKKGGYPEKVVKILVWSIVGGVLCAIITLIFMIMVNTIYPGSIGRWSNYDIFTFSNTWGSNRGATWKAGIMCFQEQNLLHKLVGVGPDAMAACLYDSGSDELSGMLRDVFGSNQILANAHNEWLTVLVDTGLIGLIGFSGIAASAVKVFMKDAGRNLTACACGFSILAYTVNNFFSFQQTVNTSTFFVILGMGMAFCSGCKINR